MRELELISSLERVFGASRSPRVLRAIGDDAAIVRAGGYAVTSVDAAVDGVHFRSSWLTPEQIGHRALATALSDLAAMGAETGEAYMLLALPAGSEESTALGVARGAQGLAERHGVVIAGGDVTRAEVMSVSFAVTGWSDDAGVLVTRAGARPGDIVVVSGLLGGAGAGLALLDGQATLDGEEREAAIRSYAQPEPRLELGRTLGAAGATAMIDISDGIATDARHLARCSGVTIELALGSLPLARGAVAVAGQLGLEPSVFAATAGEDYELCACVPGAALPIQGLTPIGQVTAGPPELRFRDWSEPLKGYEHSL